MMMYQKTYGIYEKQIFRCYNYGSSLINYQSGDGCEDLCQLNIVIYDYNTNGTNIDFHSNSWLYNVKIEGNGGGGYDQFPIYETKARISSGLVDEKGNPIIIIDDIRISSLFTKSNQIKITVTFNGEE
jgi:hypothetical protein